MTTHGPFAGGARALYLGFIGALIAGCATAPPPTREEVVGEALPETTEIPERFAAAGPEDSGAVDDGWIASFGDPQLVALVAEALENSRNLQIAAAQVDRAAGLTLLTSRFGEAAVRAFLLS